MAGGRRTRGTTPSAPATREDADTQISDSETPPLPQRETVDPSPHGQPNDEARQTWEEINKWKERVERMERLLGGSVTTDKRQRSPSSTDSGPVGEDELEGEEITPEARRQRAEWERMLP
ncbi:Hypothetical protein R9X50_00175300 [Acrodontium crateriforme]|uniref:Uncharacterized protein n=1 Tax=Acrodontium crateriforme TaxID=150365 RepID=A0AAQ3M5Q9_9PEZI|nr:Hypothetical protein R9X50_00175300 [Acrodontium crateriforme]